MVKCISMRSSFGRGWSSLLAVQCIQFPYLKCSYGFKAVVLKISFISIFLQSKGYRCLKRKPQESPPSARDQTQVTAGNLQEGCPPWDSSHGLMTTAQSRGSGACCCRELVLESSRPYPPLVPPLAGWGDTVQII